MQPWWSRRLGGGLLAVGVIVLVAGAVLRARGHGSTARRGPGTGGHGDCRALGPDVSDPGVSLATLTARYGPVAQGPLGAYILCTSAQTPAQCDRLAPRDVEGCHLDAEQIAARAAHPSGWALTPTLQRLCAEHGMDDATCHRWAAAVEAGNPALCGAQPDAVFCPAAAGGPTRCADVSAREARASCTTIARNYAALRAGVATLEHDGDVPRATLAAGVRLGPSGCLSRLETEYSGACRPARPR